MLLGKDQKTRETNTDRKTVIFVGELVLFGKGLGLLIQVILGIHHFKVLMRRLIFSVSAHLLANDLPLWKTKHGPTRRIWPLDQLVLTRCGLSVPCWLVGPLRVCCSYIFHQVVILVISTDVSQTAPNWILLARTLFRFIHWSLWRDYLTTVTEYHFTQRFNTDVSWFFFPDTMRTADDESLLRFMQMSGF